MEDFGKFIGEVVEFFVAGMLFIAAALFTVYLFWPTQLLSIADHFAERLPDSLGTPVAIFVFGLAYALGIIFEGTSRLTMEWRLRRVTVGLVRTEMTRPWAEAGMEGADVAQRRKFAENQREQLRRAVESDEAGRRAVSAQLSRLRLERSVLLASYIIMAALMVRSFLEQTPVINGYGLAALILLAFNGLMFYLVNERFGRFVKEILREYKRIWPEKVVAWTSEQEEPTNETGADHGKRGYFRSRRRAR